MAATRIIVPHGMTVYSWIMAVSFARWPLHPHSKIIIAEADERFVVKHYIVLLGISRNPSTTSHIYLLLMEAYVKTSFHQPIGETVSVDTGAVAVYFAVQK